MKNEFIPYTQSFELKKLGFEEECFGFYNNADANVWIKQEVPEELKFDYKGDIQAPTFSQAFRWFRDKYSYSSNIFFAIKGTKNLSFDIFDSNYFKTLYMSTTNYLIYEEAELDCLKKLIEIAQKSL